MSGSNRRTKEKRAQRRAGAQHSWGTADLVAHTQRCRCAACEKERADQITRGIPRTEARLEDYHCGHPHPEHRDDLQWRISRHRLIQFFAMHEKTFDPRGKLCSADMQEHWLAHLDSLVIQQALAQMQQCKPYWAWLICCCVVDGHTQSAVASWLGVNRSTICRQLRDGLCYLRDLLAAPAPEGRSTDAPSSSESDDRGQTTDDSASASEADADVAAVPA